MKVFTGLVTHSDSPYANSPTLRDLKTQLLGISHGEGITLSDTNPFGERNLPALAVVFRPFFIAMTLFRVRRYRRVGLLSSVVSAMKEFCSELCLLTRGDARKWAIRNRNITHAHFELWALAIASGNDYIAVFEDDVVVQANGFGNQLMEAVRMCEMAATQQGWALFISESFSFQTQGVQQETLLNAASGSVGLFFDPEIGWSDTVAATVYSRLFLKKLISFSEDLSELVFWSLPIDWLLDLFLLSAARASRVVTFHARPGLCKQQSLTTLS